jgi:hypothetical protein
MTQQPGRSGTDLIGDFQRWIVRSGARSVSREVSGHLRSALGRNERAADVWESATADPGQAEAPECAWCPVCRAARVLRESGPGVTSQVAAASDALAALVHDAMSVVESALASAGRTAGPGTGSAGAGRAPSGSAWDRAAQSGAWDGTGSSAGGRAGSGTAWEEAAPAGVREQAGSGPRPDPDAAGPGEEPESAGSPGGLPHEPDDRD